MFQVVFVVVGILRGREGVADEKEEELQIELLLSILISRPSCCAIHFRPPRKTSDTFSTDPDDGAVVLTCRFKKKKKFQRRRKRIHACAPAAHSLAF